MKKISISLELFWFGGNYTDKRVVSINENTYEVIGKKRYTNEVYRKVYTSAYVKRVLGDDVNVEY